MGDEKIPVWLDCDPGHDDAFAILLCVHHPRINLLGISTVHGNSSVDHTTQNACSLLTAMGRTDIPVYRGAAKGLVRPAVHAPAIHGESGLDGTDLLPPPTCTPRTDKTAIEAMHIALSAQPAGSAYLIATGTLTNISHLFTTHPSLAVHLRGLTIMGGSLGSSFTPAPLGVVHDTSRFGNYSPFAEFNVLCDPEAAASLFENSELKKKIKLLPLDVTHLVLATKDVQEMLLKGKNGNSETTLRRMLVELLMFFAGTYAEVFNITAGPPLHDPLAVAIIFDDFVRDDEELIFEDFVRGEDGRKGKKERYAIEVITEGSLEDAIAGKTETGRTVATLLPEGEEGVKIPRRVKVERFWEMVEMCLGRADEWNKMHGTGV